MSGQSSSELPHDDSGAPAHSDDHTRPGGKPSPPEVRPRDRWVSIAVCLFLALAVWAVFGQTRHFKFVNYDDPVYVYENPNVTQGLSWKGVVWAFSHVYHIVWFPLTSISHMLDCQLYGLNPGGHHLTNVLLHAATAILLFLALRKMTGARWPAVFVAAVFAIHPLRVESVAWVTERKDVLSGFFFMLTLLAYTRYAQQSKIKNQKSKIWYGLSLLFFALGLLSKSMVVTVPFILLLLDYWPLGRMRSAELGTKVTPTQSRGCNQASTLRPSTRLQLALEKIPFLLLAAADGVVTLVTQRVKVQQVRDLTFSWRIGDALLAYVDYLWHMIYPVGLAVVYPHPGKDLPLGRVGWSALVLLLISAGAVAGRRKHPYLLAGWLWYLVMLLPVIDIMQAGEQARADRYTYLPQIGLYILVAWGAAEFLGSWRHRRIVLGLGATAVIASLLAGAYAQTGYWRDGVSLWTHTLACAPESPFAHNNLGGALAAQGKWEAAIQQYERALQLSPAYANAHNNLGFALEKQGQPAEARKHFEQALQADPDLVEAHNNLGNVLIKEGKLDEGIQQCQRALELDPDYAEAHNDLGIALAGQGKLDEAIQHYERAAQLKPDLPGAQLNLGNASTALGKLDKATGYYERALQLEPDYAEAHFNLGVVLAARGKPNEGAQHFQRALALATAQNNPALADAVRAQLKALPPAPPQPQTP